MSDCYAVSAALCASPNLRNCDSTTARARHVDLARLQLKHVQAQDGRAVGIKLFDMKILGGRLSVVHVITIVYNCLRARAGVLSVDGICSCSLRLQNTGIEDLAGRQQVRARIARPVRAGENWLPL